MSISNIYIYFSFFTQRDYGEGKIMVILFITNLISEASVRKLSLFKNQAALAITGAVHETFETKLYNELGIESMKSK